MAIQNQGFRRDLNLLETEDDRNAIDNLAGAGTNKDLAFLQNNLRNKSSIPFYTVDSDGFFSTANDRVIGINQIKATGNTDDNGNKLPNDGITQGKLWSRGAAVVQQYLKIDNEAVDNFGWFDTGDVATIDKNGYMRITDRSKDIIKSGGEWISSIDLENAAVGHPEIVEAAALGVTHPKWDERPILVVVTKENSNTNYGRT